MRILIFILSLFLLLLSFHLPNKKVLKIGKQLSTSYDSIPQYFQKQIQIGYGNPWVGAMELTPDKGSITVGNIGGPSFLTAEAYVLKTDFSGNVEYAKILGVDAPYNGGFSWDISETFRDLVVLPDSGFIALGPQRRRVYGSAVNAPFLVRFDKEGNIIWSKDLKFEEGWEGTLSKITKKSNDHFLLTGTSNDIGSLQRRVFMIEMNADGEIIWDKRYSAEGIYMVINTKPIELPTGETVVQGIKDFSAPIKLIQFSIDSMGSFMAGHQYQIADSLALDFGASWALAKVEDGFLMGNAIKPTAGFFDFRRAGLLKTDLTGNLMWAKIYEDSLGITDMIDQIRVKENGDVWVNFADIYSYTLGLVPGLSNPNEAVSFAKIDTEGNIIWNRSYGESAQGSAFFFEDIAISTFQFLNDEETLISSYKRWGPPTILGVHLIKTDSLGNSADCQNQNIDIITEDLPIIQEPLILTTEDCNCWFEDFEIPIWDADVLEYDWCCEDMPDWDFFRITERFACPDGLRITMEVCNTNDAAELPDSLEIGVYDADPRKVGATYLGTLMIGNLAEGFDCEEYDVNVPFSNTGELFFVLNPPDSSAFFDLPCDFVNTSLPECNYYNNFDSLHFSEIYTTQLDFGEDYLKCPEVIDTLSVSSDFETFLWQDGSNNSIFLVTEPGIYWLEATDRCGLVHSDTIEIGEVDVPTFDLGFDSIFQCPYDTLFIAIPDLYESYFWNDNVTIFNGEDAFSCDTCPATFIYTSFSNRKIYIDATTPEGCVFKDTFYTVVSDYIAPSQTDTFTCAQSLLQLGDQFFPADTTVEIALTAFDGCDSLVEYQISALPTFHEEIFQTACEGDSLLFFNTPIPAGENKTFHFQTFQGCDSTIFVNVEALDNYQTSENIEICEGGNLLIFNNLESEAGIYSKTFTAQNGCDSLHEIELSFFSKLSTQISTQATCENENIGQATVEILSGDEPISYQWSIQNPDISAVENLPVGNHQITLTDANGCSEILSFDIPIFEETAAFLACQPQIFAPNVFSPNGDGINDKFFLQSNERVTEILSLRIFDRFGELVFEQKNISPNDENVGWDGVLDGELMHGQVFVWQAEVLYLAGEKEVIFGDVVLIY